MIRVQKSLSLIFINSIKEVAGFNTQESEKEGERSEWTILQAAICARSAMATSTLLVKPIVLTGFAVPFSLSFSIPFSHFQCVWFGCNVTSNSSLFFCNWLLPCHLYLHKFSNFSFNLSLMLALLTIIFSYEFKIVLGFQWIPSFDC